MRFPSPLGYLGRYAVNLGAFMNSKDIAKIESCFDVSLDNDYKRLLIGFPETLKKLVSVEECQEFRPIYPDAKTIIKVNKEVRDPARVNSHNPEWPKKYLVIGGNCGGNFYCLDTKSKTGAVRFWFHEDGDFEKHAKSIQEFVVKTFTSCGEIAADELNFVDVDTA